MVRSYLRHGPTECFGLIASASSPSVYDGKFAYVPSLEDVLVWDTKKGEMVAMWHETGLRSEVTCIIQSPTTKDLFAVGYADGSIRLWSAKNKSVNVVFNGHRKTITTLAFDTDGSRLASGGLDTDIILWDIVGETGLYRLRGHRGQITGLAFLPENIPSTSKSPSASNRLLSSSKDTYLKLWDLATQHCIDTVVAHRHEIWDFKVLDQKAANTDRPNDLVVVSGGGEGESKAWSIPPSDEVQIGTKDADGNLIRSIRPLASTLALASATHTQRVSQVCYNSQSSFIALQTGEKTIEVLRLRTEEEIKKKLARRKKRDREKKKKSSKSDDNEMDQDNKDRDDNNDNEDTYEWKHRLASWIVLRTNAKIRSISWGPGNASGASKTKYEAQLLVAYNSNLLEVYGFPTPGPSKVSQDATRLYSIDLPGHRTDVRTLCISSDDQLLASASNGSLKIWNIKTTKCLRTIECGYALCSTFLPGDRHVLVGTKTGQVHLYDISMSSLLETYDAHTGPVWSVQVHPDGKGAVTGSADKDIKFWDFEVNEVENDQDEEDVPKRRQLGLVHTRTLKMTDDVLGVKYSPNGALLAVALLDSTVKVFYADTLKFSLSLYGHKLPVLSLDISHDSKLIVTSSADKNVKIWGLDFGDCHRSLFAHEDSVLQVAFEKNSHYFWTTSKDKLVKYWDGDKFECIQKLQGHHAEVWALAVSNNATFVATASHDKSIRIWEKTDEPLFLEEEREREMEEMMDATMISNDQDFKIQRPGESEEPAEADEVRRQTTESLTAGEKIIEALDLAEEDRLLFESWNSDKERLPPNEAKKLPKPTRNPVFAFKNIPNEIYVLQEIKRVPQSALHDSLLVLPFSKVSLLIGHLNYWTERSIDINLSTRVLLFLLDVHQNQIVANKLMRDVLLNIRKHLSKSLQKQKDTIGYNVAALKYLKMQNDNDRMDTYLEQEGFDEDKVKERIAEAAKKRKRGVINA